MLSLGAIIDEGGYSMYLNEGDVMNNQETMQNRIRQGAGFTVMEILIVLAIFGFMVLVLGQALVRYTNAQRDDRTADRITQLIGPAQAYIAGQSAAITALIPPGNTTTIVHVPITNTDPSGDLPSMQSLGYVSSTMVDTNAFNQHHRLLIKRDSTSNALTGLIAERGGNIIPDQDLGRIATSIAGSAGGFIASHPLSGVAPGTIQGVGGQWVSTSAAWGGAPTAGYAYANISMSVTPTADYLYRDAIPGTTEPNTMHTDIHMGSGGTYNSIDNAQNVDTQTLGNSMTTGSATTGTVQATGKLNIAAGGEACTGDATGCGWAISNDGGFYDNNDGWITFNGNSSGKGLMIGDAAAGGPGNNVQVNGTTTSVGMITAQSGVQISGANPLLWSSYGGGLYMSDSTWIRTYNNNGLYTGSGQIRSDASGTAFYAPNGNVQANQYQDVANPSFYMQPSQTTNLNQVYVEYLQSSGSISAGNEPTGGNNSTGNIAASCVISAYQGTATRSVAGEGAVSNCGDVYGWDIKAEGGVYAPNIYGNNVTATANLVVPTTASEAGSCSGVGHIATDASGRLMTCNATGGHGNIWVQVSAQSVVTYYQLPPGGRALALWFHYYCALTDTAEIKPNGFDSADGARVQPSTILSDTVAIGGGSYQGTDSRGYQFWYLSIGLNSIDGGGAACID
jgi:type II secretory pathway pseudopilin PulG